LLTREKLSQLSEEELENLYQEKKAKYDQKMSKNRRIRGMLSKKVDEKQKNVNKRKKEINDLLADHPELSVVKQDFDDIEQDPAELKELIQEKQQTLSQLQSKRLQIERTITETSNHNKQQKSLEEQYQQEISSLIAQSGSLSDVSGRPELLELDQLSKEINSAQDELNTLTKEIEDIREKIHQQG